MKLIISELMSLISKRQERNIRILIKFFLVLMGMVTLYSVLFHFLMLYENQEFSWITGFYWTLTVMSTLGFGDITFHTDPGKLFSIVVLMSGLVFLLTMLPFTFIQFFYLPWLEARQKARAPRKLPEDTTRHVILTNNDPVTMSLADKLRKYGTPYVMVTEDIQQALALQDQDYKAAVGDLGDPETYRGLRAEAAALVLANINDMMNTNIAFTVREISQEVPIAANADVDDSVDILELAGSTYVFQFTKMLGQSLARRVLGSATGANVIGQIESLLIAEAPAMRTPLVDKTLEECRLRETIGVNVVGLWERGQFEILTAKTRIRSTTVLLLAGSADQLKAYDDQYDQYHTGEAPVIVLGGGRVGHAAAEVLEARGIDYRVVEKRKRLILDSRYVLGSAADIRILKRAGILDAPSVIVTTHDDPTNTYLTIYCRKLRPDIQIICRANLERNISRLHTAGADLVMSYSSMAVNTILNILKPDEMLMLAEGLSVFRVSAPAAIVGKSLSESQIREQTGCNLVAIYEQGSLHINPDPAFRFGENNELILIGTGEAEGKFFRMLSEMDRTD